MKRFLIPISLFIVCAAASAVSIVAKVAENSKASELEGVKNITIADFDEIETAFVDINLVADMPAEEARLAAPEDMIDKIEVRVDDRTLKVSYKNKRKADLRNNEQPTLTIGLRSIKSIEASNAATVKAASLPYVDELEIETSTAAAVDIDSVKVRKAEFDAQTAATIKIGNISADSLEAEASTAATVKIDTGKTAVADFTASTAATIIAKGVKANSGQASATTAGTVRCSIKNASVSSNTGGSVSNN